MFVVNLMQQQIAGVAGFDYRVCVTRVAGDHDAAVRSLEFKSNQIIKASKMAKEAASKELQGAFNEHLEQTRDEIACLNSPCSAPTDSTTRTEDDQMGALEGKVAVIAGSTSGIGARTAKLLGAEGARVVIAGRREGRGGQLAHALGEVAGFVRTDVANEVEVEAMIRHEVLACLRKGANRLRFRRTFEKAWPYLNSLSGPAG